jgi:hypothetical protein
MKQKLIYLAGLLLISIYSFAQSNNTSTSQKALTAFEKILNETGYPYTKNTDSSAIITFNGPAAIKSYSVIVFKASGVFVAFVDISTNMGIKVDPSKYKNILRANNSYDLVKFGLEEDGALTVRYEIYENGIKSENLKRIINQVAAATEEIAPQLK